ncbi:hypothetical protein PSHT_15201 [Puccinia striiformis]|uniref:Uncharacterized protein n=1 Tax=Puccinia striiformis TaxID=27350 RepID=A0A2S4UGA1_9BASI|nr:hypothetical protein PSHT_15201 [Puccinia striiformis]
MQVFVDPKYSRISNRCAVDPPGKLGVGTDDPAHAERWDVRRLLKDRWNFKKLDLGIGQMEILDAETPGEASIALGLGEGGIDKTAPDADNNPVPSDLDTPNSALNDQIIEEDATLTPVEIDIPQNLA